jgi:hypothetical protein
MQSTDDIKDLHFPHGMVGFGKLLGEGYTYLGIRDGI